MRRRAGVLLLSLLSAGALVAGGMVTDAGAAVSAKKAPFCKGKTKKKAIKDIKTAYDHFLNGTDFPDALNDKAPYIQYLSEPNVSQSLLDAFVASSASTAADAGNTNVRVNKV